MSRNTSDSTPHSTKRARYGCNVVYFGSMQESRDEAPMRISFAHIPDLKIEQD